MGAWGWGWGWGLGPSTHRSAHPSKQQSPLLGQSVSVNPTYWVIISIRDSGLQRSERERERREIRGKRERERK